MTGNFLYWPSGQWQYWGWAGSGNRCQRQLNRPFSSPLLRRRIWL